MNKIEVAPGLAIGDGAPLVLFAGPCVIESEAHLLRMGSSLRDLCKELKMPFVFKASFDKANRTSVDAYRGPGFEEGLRILGRVKQSLGIPLLVDIHLPEQADAAAKVADVLQIPAFLCRQTDLLRAAALTGKPVNVKKGQFLSPWDAKHIIGKVSMAGNQKLMLTERGSSFGYNNLVVDMRALPVMRAMGTPVLFDATHSLQLPGGNGDSTGGMREFVPHMARAAVAAGVDGLFMEVHDDPDQAPCDGPNMWPLNDLRTLLKQVLAIDEVVRKTNTGVCG